MDLEEFKDQNKYNLFVTSEENAWENNSYIMPIDRCLTSYTTPEIKVEYSLFVEQTMGIIKKYPCIFAYEDYRKRDSYIGYIKDAIIRTSGIKFVFEKIGNISFEKLHSLAFELDINMSGSITELMHTHWTIKTVNLYKELNKEIESIESFNKPTVFISYCWTPKENKDKVIKLADRLEKDGVKVLYDKKSLLPGQDMNAFMESLANNINIKKILVICNSDYAKKADNRQGGVGTEAEIIIPQVYGNPIQNKIVPVFFEVNNEGKPYCPLYLRSRYGIDFTGNYEDGYSALLEDIYR